MPLTGTCTMLGAVWLYTGAQLYLQVGHVVCCIYECVYGASNTILGVEMVKLYVNT